MEAVEKVEILEGPTGQEKPPVYWMICSVAIVLLSIFMRFWQLGLKPFHHDEGVNGFFLTTLFREGVYKYDPANYHGPTLYYISLIFSKVFGLEDFSVRASVAIFGVLMVWLALSLRRHLGHIGSLAGALFLALSPGMVFISRYFIHEIFFVFLSLAIVAGVLFFIEGRKPGLTAIIAMTLILFVAFVPPGAVLAAYLGGDDESTVTMLKVMFFVIQALAVVGVMYLLLGWRSGRPIYLLLASACASLFFATKETAFITLGTMLIALISVWIWQRIYGAVNSGPGEDDLSPVRLTWARFRDGMGSGWDNVGLLVACVGLFAYLWVLFFSSFFSYWDGIAASFNAYTIWTKTGSTDHTQNGYLGYVKWLVKLELPIAILSAVGIVVAFLKGRHRFALFTALWAFGLFLAYTIIAYKTPWLALSFILPMCLIAGYAVNEIVKVRNLGKPLGGFLALSAVAVLGFQSYNLNFVKYDDDGKPYVYAHTLRGYGDLIKEIDRYSAKSQLGEAATVQVVSPDYWPMPWSLRKYKSAQFFGRFVDSNSAEMIVAKKDEQESGLVEKYAVHYRVAGVYPLRPGVELILLVRRDLAEPGAKDVYRLMDAASQ